MKIFISLFSGIPKTIEGVKLPAFYETFIRALEKTGNELLVYVSSDFGINYEKMPEKLLKEIKEFNPELCILFNNTFYDISRKVDCPIVIYEVDSPLYYSNKKQLRRSVSRYKFVISQDESRQQLRDFYGVRDLNIFQAPFFTEVLPEDKPIKHNISFIGTNFYSSKNLNLYNLFVKENPTIEETNQFIKILEYVDNHPFVTPFELVSLFDIKSEKIKAHLKPERMVALMSGYNRVKTLSAVADLGLGLYGTKNWAIDSYNEPYLILNYISEPVYSIKHNQDIYNSSKIGININHKQVISGFSWRVCDILASNACLVTEYKPNIQKYFASANIPMFTNPYEARELCQKILKNENLRKDIVEASQELINSSFRFEHTKKLLEEFLDVNLTGTGSYTTRYMYHVVKRKKRIFKISKTQDKNTRIVNILNKNFKVEFLG